MGIFDDIHAQVLKENEDKLSKLAPEELKSIVETLTIGQTDEFSNIILVDLKKNSLDMLEEHRLIRIEFEARLQFRWRKALNNLEELIVMSLEAAEMFCKDFTQQAQIKNNLTFYAIRQIHARAIQISYEILTLLKSGYSEGALGRWRTLHELTVTAIFLEEYNSNDLTQKYLDYSEIELYYENKSFYEHSKTKDNEEPKYMKISKDIFNEMKKKYGDEFVQKNGWAFDIFNKTPINFTDIEKKVKLSHLRPYYKLACTTTHSSPKGDFYKIGVIDEYLTTVMPCGPSNYGLSLPGQNTAISLVIITSYFLNLFPSIDSIVSSKIIKKFLNEVLNEFYNIQSKIEKEEEEKN